MELFEIDLAISLIFCDEYFITKKLVDPNIEGCTVKRFYIGTDENLYFVYRIIEK